MSAFHSSLSRRVVVGALAAALGVAALPAAAQNCEDPKVLKYSIIPTQDSVRELGLYKPVIDLLAKNTGKKIEFYMPTSYSSVVEALMGKWVDVATLGPESYVIGHNKDPNIEVFATYSKTKDGVQEAGPGYKSMLITKKGSKFTTVESLKGAGMLLVDPASALRLLRARDWASSPASRSSSASATTLVMSPACRASSAVISRPVSTRSSATFSPTARRRSVMTMAGTKPRWISG